MGGGPTGVEMAGGLRELYTKVLAKDFPQLPVAEARITLVEMAEGARFALAERPLKYEPKAAEALDHPDVRDRLARLAERLGKTAWDRAGLDAALRDFTAAEGVKLTIPGEGRDPFDTILTVSPPIPITDPR